jgi:hypothetical protein
MKTASIVALAFSVLVISCKEKTRNMANENEVQSIFPKGELGSAVGMAQALKPAYNNYISFPIRRKGLFSGCIPFRMKNTIT